MNQSISSNKILSAYIKNLKYETKDGYVDIIVSYEIENRELDIDDFIKVKCYSTIIEFKPEQNKKTLLEAAGFPDISEWNNNSPIIKLSTVEKQLQAVWANKGGIESNPRAMFASTFIQFAKENIKNMILILSGIKKGMPKPSYTFKTDNQFRGYIEQDLKKIQQTLNTLESSQNPHKQYIHFLETPVTINGFKLIKVSLSDSDAADLDDLNRGMIFDCQHLGYLSVPFKQQINKKQLEETMWALLPKHCTFVIAKKEDKQNLTTADVKTGYWRYSSQFIEGLAMVLRELSQ